MQNNSDHLKSTERILKRAEELAKDTSRSPADLRHAELLAAISDGTIQLEDVDEETLDKVIETFGIEAVSQAFQDKAERRTETQRPVTARPAQVVPFPTRRWTRGWMATAASIAAVVAVGWFIVKAPDEIPVEPKSGISIPKDSPNLQTPWWRWSALTFSPEDIWDKPVTSRPESSSVPPVNPATAGLSGVVPLAPQLLDVDNDGAAEGLLYRYAPRNETGGAVDAIAVFMDFAEAIPAATASTAQKVPRGLWGMEESGAFPVGSFVLMRTDGLVAVGYSNAQGTVDEVRIGQFSDITDEVWKLQNNVWTSSRPAATLQLLDSARLGSDNEQKARALVNAAFKR